jgi:hypothetical protein
MTLLLHLPYGTHGPAHGSGASRSPAHTADPSAAPARTGMLRPHLTTTHAEDR